MFNILIISCFNNLTRMCDKQLLWSGVYFEREKKLIKCVGKNVCCYQNLGKTTPRVLQGSLLQLASSAYIN